MPLPVIFIVSALVCYSTAIWSERLSKGGLVVWMVGLMILGCTADVAGTGMMMNIARAKKLAVGPHGICGYLALGIMFVHVLWAVAAMFDTRWQGWFSRFSIYAWGLWMIAFLLGIPRMR